MLRSRLNSRFMFLVVLLIATLGQTQVRADINLASITVGTTPLDVAVSPDNSRVYVTNTGSSTVSVINTASNTVIATVPVAAGSITNLAVSPDNSKVYVVSQNTNTIQIISAATLTVTGSIAVGTTPIDVAFDSLGYAYVTNYTTQSVTVITVSTNSVYTTITGLDEGPRGVVAVNVPGSGTRVYIAHAGPTKSEVSYFAAPNGTVHYIPVSGNPFFVAARPDGTKIYASLSSANQTASISAATNTVLTYVADFGGTPFGIAVAATPTGNRVFVADSNGNGFGYAVTRIDSASDTAVGQLFVGNKPKGVAASPNGTRVYVAASSSNKVNVIDTTQ
jgi:YVTN family beta-propeller protein